MQGFFDSVTKNESGAVAVDWLAITGGIVALGLLLTTTIHDATTTVATDMETAIADLHIADFGPLGFAP